MSHVSELRGRIESVILGTAGTSRVTTLGRFVQDTGEGLIMADASERRFEVVAMEGAGSRPYNPLDGFKLENFDVTIRIHYALTNSGGDAVESSNTQGGPGTLDAIRDRANSDRMELERVLTWHENTFGVSLTGCVMIGMFEDTARAPSGNARGSIYVYEIFYKMLANVTAAASEVTS